MPLSDSTPLLVKRKRKRKFHFPDVVIESLPETRYFCFWQILQQMQVDYSFFLHRPTALNGPSNDILASINAISSEDSSMPFSSQC